MKEFNFTLGVVEKLNVKMENVVAQDINCNKFNIQLVHDSSLNPYDLTGATSAILYFLRSDNLVFQEYATITNHSQGRLEIILATDTFAVSGVAVAEVAIYAGEEMKCTSQTFKFNIRKPLNDGEVYVSGNDLPNYKAELARLETILENLIITAGDSNPEIVAARYSIADGIDYATIGDRMDAIDTKIDNVEIDLTPIENAISDLAGSGRTTETVKGNADNITAFRSDYLSGADSPLAYNLLPDSGRFVPTGTPLTLTTTAPFAANPFFMPYNGSTPWTSAGKFIHNNTNFGGTAGVMTSDVEALMNRMDSLGVRATKRYGAEFYVGQMTMGTGTDSPFGDGKYLATINNQMHLSHSISFGAWIKIDQGTAAIRYDPSDKLYKNMTEKLGHVYLEPEDGWTFITKVSRTQTGYSNGFPLLYAEPGTVIQIALPAVVPGGIGLGWITSPMPATAGQHIGEKVSDGVHGMGSIAAQEYEEGTWTPTLATTGVNAEHTYAYRSGKYTRIGRRVFLEGYIELSQKNIAATGTISVSGAPFTVKSMSLYRPNAAAGSFGNLNMYDASVVGILMLDNTSNMLVRRYPSDQPALPINDIADNFYIQFAISYEF